MAIYQKHSMSFMVHICQLLLVLCFFSVSSISYAEDTKMVIVLDAGHGGIERGAQSQNFDEADIALDVALRSKRLLEDNGFEVLLTRESDTTLGLKNRPDIANKANADVFISIHVNSAESASLHGIETYSVDIATDAYSAMVALKENMGIQVDQAKIPKVNTNTMLLSMELADLVQNNVMDTLVSKYETDSIVDLGHKTAMFSVLVHAQMPAILLEVGFMSNSAEFTHIQSAHYRESIGQSLVTALLEWEERNK